ncbi:NADH dehydrogenase FAD-containing subunit [Lipingzhangella halophila]|uniref:NADH dehydrogenase FAD-containing subunit n=1 Tax=Lipingzhangella halophila TaxID=1783352 RepID=A0A7W7W3D0_9ACTN|nr:FAD-dependent oxidoreductase [Lipingzhangella halophila]MBB4931605.1 NADH dehydrogenase FAD-containing subunit [Lipingzhangella halophila]
MSHTVAVLGAGYAGLMAAQRLARQTRREEVRIVLVNATDRFVERVRLHQTATDQPLPARRITESVRGTGIRVRIAEVTGVDADQRRVRLTEDGVPATQDYDTLVYGLGSATGTATVPGTRAHAHTLAEWDQARSFAAHTLSRLTTEGGNVTVVGGGLTGLETATELAESRPELSVRLVTRGPLGQEFSPRGRAYLHRTMHRLGIELVDRAPVSEVLPGGMRLGDGRQLGADAVLWTAGFAVSDLARKAGLEVDDAGRITVDTTQRSVSHPEVYAVGDAAHAPGPGGRPLRMACATGGPMAWKAADAIAARLSGDEPAPLRFAFFNWCVSLGRRDGLIQFVRSDDTPRTRVLTGRAAAAYKEAVVRGAAAAPTHGWLSGPYLPRPRRRISTAQTAAPAERG